MGIFSALLLSHTSLPAYPLSYYSVDLLRTSAEVQIENVMCANAFRAEVRLILPLFGGNTIQYGEVESTACYSGCNEN